MANLEIIEVYDGRLPEFQVIQKSSSGSNENKILKTFDTYDEAEKWSSEYISKLTPCGEENPCK